jgi:hypothetical protein
MKLKMNMVGITIIKAYNLKPYCVDYLCIKPPELNKLKDAISNCSKPYPPRHYIN